MRETAELPGLTPFARVYRLPSSSWSEQDVGKRVVDLDESTGRPSASAIAMREQHGTFTDPY